jgi:peptidoglycan hydrolase-like protein with peptidoglycan-binding domain
MELATYLYDAWAYEQANQEPANQDRLDWLDGNFSKVKRQACLLVAIAFSGVSGLSGNLVPAIAAHALEASINVAPWCNNLYLCNTSYILEVQTLLVQRGFAVGEIDGVYGRYTKQAVIEFQQTESSLIVDGIPGKQTIALLRNVAMRQPLSNHQRPNNNQKIEPKVSSDRAKQKNISQSSNQTVIVVRRSPAPQSVNSPEIDEIGNLQILLKQRGFYQGEIDGRQGRLRDFAQTPSSNQNAPLLPPNSNSIDTK